MLVNNSVVKNTASKPSESRFARRSFTLMGSNVLKLFVQLAIIYLYSRKLSVLEYGQYQSVWLYLSVLSVLGLFGLPAMMLSTPFYALKHWILKHKFTFSTATILLYLLPFSYLFLSSSQFNPSSVFLLAAITILQNVGILAETVAIKMEKEWRLLLANLFFAGGYLLVHIVLLKMGYSLNRLLLGLMLLFLMKILLLPNSKKVSFPVSEQETSNALGKQWLYLGVFDVIGVLFKWLDKWMVLFFISLSQFAIYFNGSYEIPLFGLMLSAVGNVMLVELSKGKAADAELPQNLFHQSAVFLGSLVFPAFCFLLFYHVDFFRLIFSPKYDDSIPIFFISLFVLPLRITHFTVALQVYQRNDLIVKGAILDLLLAMVFMVILYPLFQLKGIALSFVLCTYVQAAYYLWHTSKIIKLPVVKLLPFKRLILMAFISTLVMGITRYLSFGFFYPLNLICGVVTSLLLAASLLAFWFRKGIRKYF